MIRTNLSTRPFYNDRAVTLWLLVAATVIAGATVFNAARVMRDSGSNTELVRQASQDEERAADARRGASILRATVDVKQIDAASLDARQANDLIDRRTFSWTELFNRFENTLPDDVRITSVSPSLDRQRSIVLTVTVLARTVDDVNEFMERLDGSGTFRELRSTQEHMNESDQIESVLQMIYLPAAPAPGAQATPAAEAPSAPGAAAPPAAEAR